MRIEQLLTKDMTSHQAASLVRPHWSICVFPAQPASDLFTAIQFIVTVPFSFGQLLGSSWTRGVSVELDKSVLLASLARLPIFLLFFGAVVFLAILLEYISGKAGGDRQREVANRQ
jgi:hypothetical protein